MTGEDEARERRERSLWAWTRVFERVQLVSVPFILQFVATGSFGAALEAYGEAYAAGLFMRFGAWLAGPACAVFVVSGLLAHLVRSRALRLANDRLERDWGYGIL